MATELRFTKRLLGLSADHRTNKWELTCSCGKKWKPTTTMLAKREEECPKCLHWEIVDYNEVSQAAPPSI